MKIFLFLFFITWQCLLVSTLYGNNSEQPLPTSSPFFLSFDELCTLAKTPHPQGPLKDKMNSFFATPLIDNSAYTKGTKPFRPYNQTLKSPVLRVSSWNIEKSMNITDAMTIFSSQKNTIPLIDQKRIKPHSRSWNTLMSQQHRLATSDIIILQEMEIGMKRSGYRNAAHDLAHALRMNYAFAPQYLEVDPVLLGMETITQDDGTLHTAAMDYFRADRRKYKGVFGSAVLSRYPITHVEIVPLKYQGYDWYYGEKKKTTFLEHTRRLSSKVLFKNELTREMKVGGRIFFRVDLRVPDVPEQTISIINIHLEIKCLPLDREMQMAEILSYIQDIKHPVIVMGDFNSAARDLSPTSLGRETTRFIKNPTNWFSFALNYITPEAFTINVGRGISNVTKNYDNPLAWHIPVVAPNPLRNLFKRIHTYRFYDSGYFDFRGDKKRSVNDHGTLSNSNECDLKGFKTTFQVKRPLGPILGKVRLDWAFVKAYQHLYNKDDNRSYVLAPHFGETCEELNTGLKTQVSDHHPNVIDLPLQEPQKL